MPNANSPILVNALIQNDDPLRYIIKANLSSTTATNKLWIVQKISNHAVLGLLHPTR
ncbi:hypothetical protein D1872_273140 [compost metagenome]